MIRMIGKVLEVDEDVLEKTDGPFLSRGVSSGAHTGRFERRAESNASVYGAVRLRRMGECLDWPSSAQNQLELAGLPAFTDDGLMRGRRNLTVRRGHRHILRARFCVEVFHNLLLVTPPYLSSAHG
jgi:hypothetical protein